MERQDDGLDEDAAKCYELWIQRKPLADIAENTGLTQKAVRSRIVRARMGHINTKARNVRADAAACLDDVIRRCYVALHWENELKPMEHVAFLKLVADTAVQKAALYGPATRVVREFEEME